MPDFNIRSDSVNVEQIMEQIRARIREKRGVDYTDRQIQELAGVKLEKFLDPRGVRSDLLEQFRRARTTEAPNLPNYAFEEDTLFESHRAPLRWVRRLLQPLLKLFFNPNRLIQALHIQSQLNTRHAEAEARRLATEHLQYELVHNLVVELTRMGIEVKNLKMRVESLTGRLEFNERRARALESVVAYKPSREDRGGDAEAVAQVRSESAGRSGVGTAAVESVHASAAPAAQTVPEGPGQRSRRRRRRRGRRGGGSAAVAMGGQAQTESLASPVDDDLAAREAAAPHEETAETIEQAMAAESLPAESTHGAPLSSEQDPVPHETLGASSLPQAPGSPEHRRGTSGSEPDGDQ
jgi:hypothetical protein